MGHLPVSVMIEQSVSPQKSRRDDDAALRPTSSIYRRSNTMTADGEIAVGSYCFCDCDSYLVVVKEIKANGAFEIVDLFEQRERTSYSSRLWLIDDDKKLRMAQLQHKQFLSKQQMRRA